MDRTVNIKDYLPDVIKELREFDAISTAENPELTDFWSTLNDVMNDQFVSDATENGVKRWEKILNIKPFDTDDLDFRKFRIESIFQKKLPFTHNSLKMLLTEICGEDGFLMELDAPNYSLTIKGKLIVKQQFNEVNTLVQKVIPANMIVKFVLMYNQYQTLAPLTHARLHAYKYIQLRNEVLPIA